MFYVYILKSKKYPNKVYTGFSKNLKQRLIDHNKISNKGYTKQFQPWEIVTYVCFSSEKLAREFEKYLKTGSGIAFMRKRLLEDLTKPKQK